MPNYIYLLQEREFTKTNENIYKIGMTQKDNLERFNQYPKGSLLLFQMICNDCKNIENCLIKIFKEKFIQRKDIGTEYFEGNYKSMIDIIYLTIKDECIKDECDTEDSEYDEDSDDNVNEVESEDSDDNLDDVNLGDKHFTKKYNLQRHLTRQYDCKINPKQHTCELCHTVFNRKEHLYRHTNKLRKCNVATDFDCGWCSKSFSNNSNLSRHINTCKVKCNQDQLESKIQEEAQLTNDRVEELEAKYKILEDKVNTHTVAPITTETNTATISGSSNTNAPTHHSHNPITTTTNSHNTTNITINNYGQEDLSVQCDPPK